MASSPSSIASSSDLYAASESIEENTPPRSEEGEPQVGQVSTLAHGIVSPIADMVPKGRTLSEDGQRRNSHYQSPQFLDNSPGNRQPKRKRDEDRHPFNPAGTGSKSPRPKPQDYYFSDSGQNTPEVDDRPYTKKSPGVKRAKLNGHVDAEPRCAANQTRAAALPAELWHHIFRFVPPVFLGRLLRVNRAFHSYLTSPSNGSKLATSPSYTGIRPLDSETIWASSRKRFAAGLPKPLRGLQELDLWRLLRGETCQLCGTTKNPTVTSRSEVDLLLSSECPSFLLPALPFAFVSSSMNYIPNTLLRETAAPPSTRIVKRFYKPHVQQIKQKLDRVKELGAASADEWSKGLAEEGRERINNAIRWEQWEAKGGLKKVNLRPQAKAIGSSNSISTTRDHSKPRDVNSHGSALQPGPPMLSYNAPAPNVPVVSADSCQYPQHPPPMPTLRPERTMKEINEAKAARRAEIERRCSFFSPPLLPNILSHMESFQAAIQIPAPLADAAWDLLKPRLLNQRANAEKREQEQVQQNELLQSEFKQRRYQETQSKDTKESMDRHWDSVQAPVRDRLGVLADVAIDERWSGGRAVTKENSPKFAADVLLYVRQRFYDEVARVNEAATISGEPVKSDPPNGPPTQTLTLENMKWLFDTKIKPFTEHFQRELFLCNGCDDNFKFYGFEGVIQHYAAKHTSSLSMGSVVVYWRAEWPEEPPFNPEPSPSKSAYYNVPSPGAGGSNTWVSGEKQPFNSNHGYGTAFEAGPKQTGNGTFAHTNTTYHGRQTVPYPDAMNLPPYHEGYSAATVPVGMPDGLPSGFISYSPSGRSQQGQGSNAVAASIQATGRHDVSSQYHGYSYSSGYSLQGMAPGTVYASQPSFRAPPPRPPHFDPSRNNAAQLTEGYQQQMDEMAKQARDVWHSTSNIRNLPASVRIYVVIRHVAARFSEKFTTVPSLAMFLDGLDNNAQMRPPPASDRRLYTLPHLLNHFRTAHLEGPQAFASPNSGPDGPKYDWTRDMIELPENHLVAELVHSLGMDDNKLDLLAWAFPDVFPSPLPPLAILRSSSAVSDHGEVSSVTYYNDDYSQGRGRQPIPVTAIKDRIDSPSCNQPPNGFRPVSYLSRPSEPPGEDEYDPHKPAYQGNRGTAGSNVERAETYARHPADRGREKFEWHQPSYERRIPETTDLSKLLFSATQARPVHEPPEHQADQHHLPVEIASPAFLKPERGEGAAVRGLFDDRRLAHHDRYQSSHPVEDYASEDGGMVHGPLASANVRAAEQFLQNLGQASDIEANRRPQSHEQGNVRSSINPLGAQRRVDAVEATQYSTKSLGGEDYRLAQATCDMSPDSSVLASRPGSRNTRNISRPYVYGSGMYSQANHQRAASNALIRESDSASNGWGPHTNSDYPTFYSTAVADRHSRNGYSIERPDSSRDALPIAHDRDRPGSPIPVTVDTTYYHSRSPIEDVQSESVYRIRSPFRRKEPHAPRTFYEYPRPDRYEVVEEHEYAPTSQGRLPQRIEYVPVRIGNHAPPNSGRYIVAQPMDARGQADYVRLEEPYDQGAVYERDGQLYRSEPRTYRAPLSRGNDFSLGKPSAGSIDKDGRPQNYRKFRYEINCELSAHTPHILSAEEGLSIYVEQPNEGDSSPEEQEVEHEQVRSAIYDYASEKSLSHEESKLFYQHNRDSRQNEPDPSIRVARARTFSLNYTEGRSSRRRWRSGGYPDSMGREPGLGVSDRPAYSPQAARGPVKVDRERDVHSDRDKDSLVEAPDDGPGIARPHISAQPEESVLHDASISTELWEMSSMIQRVLDLRHKYIELSLQRPGDNPKDHADWKVYPEPPKPVWTEETTLSANPSATISRVNSNTFFGAEQDLPMNRSQASLASVAEEPTRPRPASPPRKQRKPGQDIGSDFDMSYFDPMPCRDGTTDFELDEGSVYQVYETDQARLERRPWIKVPTLRDYYMDLNVIKEVSEDGPIKSFAFRELQILDGKFNLYTLENSYAEMMESKGVPHRDFYNVRKVDTHVHHSACMNSKHLLRFIKSKLKKSASDIVMFRDGKEMTLRDVFDSLDMTAYDLSIDTLDTHAHTDSFHRFDKFNLKYNPVGSSRLREIFLKTDNYIQGRYLAELTREVIADLENSKYQMVEWRVSIYGRTLDEWDKLAAWVIDNKLVSHNVRWLIQIPRLYSLYKKQKIVENFEQLIVNIFQPLYEVTRDPSSHPKLHAFLHRVIGFDSVDDESKVERRYYRKFPTPRDWTAPENPMYNYWIYFLWANMVALNHWRKRRGLGTFVLRPHCGEAGDVEHLQSAVLCCHSISHGLLLRKASLLQYIFYLDQIGIAMSPLSNNALFLAYDRNPFQVYFRRGLNVSLSTDDPLQFAYTKEPLIEEYSVAAQICKLSAADMCELAQHSVTQSGFEYELKQRWLGPNYQLPGVQGNNVAKTNVPNMREGFRHNTLENEREMIARYARAHAVPNQSPTSASLDAQPTIDPRAADNRSRAGPVQTAQGFIKEASRSSVELQSPGTTREHPRVDKRERAWVSNAFPDSPTRGGHRQPSIFPGVVRQRTRRKSLRQSSGSENDHDASGGSGVGLPRSWTLVQEAKKGSDPVPEEPGA
ncbi:MAG: hypothetical protein Q9216_001008 [Gyalolechia sp. 2 TL-2023]